MEKSNNERHRADDPIEAMKLNPTTPQAVDSTSPDSERLGVVLPHLVRWWVVVLPLMLAQCETHYPKINGHTPCAMGTCWHSYPSPCDCSHSTADACFCGTNDYHLPYR